jgi:hypothetical protein
MKTYIMPKEMVAGIGKGYLAPEAKEIRLSAEGFDLNRPIGVIQNEGWFGNAFAGGFDPPRHQWGCPHQWRENEMTKPTMDAVDSSNIEAIGYRPESRECHVQFKGGATYVHEEFPADLYAEFKASPSKGSFYHARIKNQFKTTKADA